MSTVISRLAGEANKAFAKAFAGVLDNHDDTGYRSTYALVLGRSQDNEHNIVPAEGSYAAGINSFFGDVGMVLSDAMAPMSVCKRIRWKRMMFQAWDPNKNQTNQSYYCESGRRVYLCLDNGNGAISGVDPASTGTSPQPIRTEDGYLWQYLYSISGNMFHYMRNLGGIEYMPVPPILTEAEYSDLATTNPLFLKKAVERYGEDHGGELIRVVVNEDQMRYVRWDSVSSKDFEILEQSDNPGEINAVFDYHGPGEADENKRGFSLTKVDVLEKGSGYSMNLSLKLGKAPNTNSQNITGYNANQIVGGSASSIDPEIKGPFVYAIASPPTGFGDAIGLLRAYQAMLLIVIDTSGLREYTDATTFDTAAIVKNPLYNNKPIKDTLSPGKQSLQAVHFSAATKITLANNTVSQSLTAGVKSNSMQASGNTSRMGSTISSNILNSDGKRVIRIQGQGANNLDKNDNVFKEKANTDMSEISFSTKTPATSTPVVDITKTPLKMGKDVEGNWSEVIHTFKFPAITVDQSASGKADNSLALAVIVG